MVCSLLGSLMHFSLNEIFLLWMINLEQPALDELGRV